ncbi:MAG: ABC transporter ATP-binding protein [bacterium]|nr:ABC transporter ATP-binding protein [bacterium]
MSTPRAPHDGHGRQLGGGEGLEVRNISVALEGNEILTALDLAVRRGEILALLGPSGCGKTTLLRAVAGLIALERGSVHWAGEDLHGVPTHRRRFGMVFQDHALLPHRNVGANVAFGLRMQGMPAQQRRRRVGDMLRMVGLKGCERRSVATLSGGEAQRVALARALAPEPKLLLADEPFAALDRPLHDRLISDVRRILTDLGQTVIHVTHDHAEAFAIADRVALMRDGRIHRTARPQQLRADPRDAWTATFLGLGTIWQPPERGVPVTAGLEVSTPWGLVTLAPNAPTEPPREGLCLLIRPDAVRPGGPAGVRAHLSDVRVVGDRSVATFDISGAPPLEAYVPAGVTKGRDYHIALDPEGIILLPPER